MFKKSKRWFSLALVLAVALTMGNWLAFNTVQSVKATDYFTYGVLLVDFEDDVVDVGEYGFTASISESFANTGSKSLKLSSETEIGWGAARIYLNLGNQLGAEGSSALDMTYLGFHIKGPKGSVNDVSGGEDVLIQDIQLASGDKGWHTYKAGSTFYLLPDGDSSWSTRQTISSSAVIPGDFSGYVVLDITCFDVGDASEILSALYDTRLSLNFNKAGGASGDVFMDSFFYTTGDVFPETSVIESVGGVLLVDFEDDVVDVGEYGFTASISKSFASTGSKSLKLSSETEIGWGAARIYLNLGNQLGAEGSPALDMTYLGFHIKGPKGSANDVSGGEDVLIQDIQLASGDKGWHTYKAGSTFYLLPDGNSSWSTRQTISSSAVIPGDFSGYVLLDITCFDVGDASEILSALYDTRLSLNFNKAGGASGDVFMDSFFYTTRLNPTETFPHGKLLLDFEDGIGSVEQADVYEFTASSSDEHASTGSKSLKLSSETEIGWGAARIYLSLGNQLGAEGSSALSMTGIGFHVKAPKGIANDISSGDVLLQDVQLASNMGWFTYQPDCTYYLLADGEDTWIEHKTTSSSTVIPSEFSGYVLYSLKNFAAAGDYLKTGADILSEQNETRISLHFNKAGGALGDVFMDSFFYATRALADDSPSEEGDSEDEFEDIDKPSFDYDLSELTVINGTGTPVKSQVVFVLNDFENGQEDIDFMFRDKTANNKFTMEPSNQHTGDGKYGLKLSSPVSLNWNTATPYMRIGDALGLESNPASRMTYIGFHIKTSLGTDFRIQDIQLASGSWYNLSGQATIYVMADGADEWTVADAEGSSLFLKSNWSGFIALPVFEFYNDGKALVPAEDFSNEYDTQLQVHYNQAGGKAESIFFDSLFFSIEETFDTTAVQLVKEDGSYFAGKSNSPVNGALTTTASSSKILDIDGYRIFARETTVGAFKGLLTVPSGMTVKVFKGEAEAADGDDLAVGMVVKVFEGSTVRAAYVIAHIRSTPVPSRDFVVKQVNTDENSPVVITGQNITAKGLTAADILTNYVSTPYGMTAGIYNDGVQLEDGKRIKQGMTLRCFDSLEPALYYEYIFNDVDEVDITGGLKLKFINGSLITVEGDTIFVPKGMTVRQLIDSVVCGEGTRALVLDADEYTADDDALLTEDMFLMIANDIFEELGRWHISLSNVSPPDTGENAFVVPLCVLMFAAATCFILIFKKGRKAYVRC